MRVSKVNECTPIKIRKQYLNELVDFCRYGYCLEEETAKAYLEFLVDAINKVKSQKGSKVADKNLDKINTNRFNSELRRDPELVDGYFEDGKGTLSEFENLFARAFQQLKSETDEDEKRKIPQEWIKWLQDAFNNYVSRFEKRTAGINTDFADRVDWTDKGEFKGKHLPSSAK